jgi:hypothetical protein
VLKSWRLVTLTASEPIGVRIVKLPGIVSPDAEEIEARHEPRSEQHCSGHRLGIRETAESACEGTLHSEREKGSSRGSVHSPPSRRYLSGCAPAA